MRRIDGLFLTRKSIYPKIILKLAIINNRNKKPAGKAWRVYNCALGVSAIWQSRGC